MTGSPTLGMSAAWSLTGNAPVSSASVVILSRAKPGGFYQNSEIALVEVVEQASSVPVLRGKVMIRAVALAGK